MEAPCVKCSLEFILLASLAGTVDVTSHFMTARNHLIILSSWCLVFLLFFGLYLSTASPEIFPGANHGELTVSGATLGIAHPTGYPLWINLVHGFSRIPMGTIAWRVNLMTALLGALCPVILLLIMRHLKFHLFAAYAGAMGLGLDLIYWQQATAAEVYGLHLVLISLFFLFILKSTGSDSRWFLLACFILALSAANHALTIFWIPLLFISPHARRFRNLISGFLFTLPGIGIYIYLPVRASVSPEFSWFDPSGWPQFFSHITGTQFHQQMLGSPLDLIISRLSAGAGQFLSGTHILIWPAAILGGILLVRTQTRFRWPILLFLTGNLAFSLSYAIHDIDAYFLPILWFTAIAAGFGFHVIFLRLAGSGRIIAPVFLFLIFFTGFSLNFAPADRSGITLATDYGKSLLRSCPHNAVLYYQGDNPTNSLSYLYFVENRRQDITFIDMNSNLKRFGTSRSPNGNRPIIKTYRGIANRKFLTPFGIAYMDLSSSRSQPPASEIISLPGAYFRDDVPRESACRAVISEYLINRGEFESERGNWESGLEFYRMADTTAQGIPDVRQFVAVLMASRGWLKDAIAIEESVINSGAASPEILNNLSYHYYMACKQPGRAAGLVEDAIRQDPENTQFRRTLAQIYLITGKLSDAYDLLKNRSDSSPDLLDEIQRLEKATSEFPDLKLNLFDARGNVSNPGIPLSRYRKLMAWRHARVLLRESIYNGVTDGDTLNLFVSVSRACGTIPDALECLEDRLRQSWNPEIQKILHRLHREEFNTMRAKSLIPSASFEPGEDR